MKVDAVNRTWVLGPLLGRWRILLMEIDLSVIGKSGFRLKGGSSPVYLFVLIVTCSVCGEDFSHYFSWSFYAVYGRKFERTLEQIRRGHP